MNATYEPRGQGTFLVCFIYWLSEDDYFSNGRLAADARLVGLGTSMTTKKMKAMRDSLILQYLFGSRSAVDGLGLQLYG